MAQRTFRMSETRRRVRVARGCVTLGLLALCARVLLQAQPVPVRHPEVPDHRQLVLRTLAGDVLGNGELIQTVSGTLVTTRLVLRFGDASLHDESVTFSQEGQLRLIRDRLVQRGPAFPLDLDMTIDRAEGRVTVRAAARDGSEKRYDERLQLPEDLANGFIPMALKNVARDERRHDLSLVVATPRPRLVRLAVRFAGLDPLAMAAGHGPAAHFVLRAEIGGLAGWLAPLVGKQPPDSHVWLLDGAPPSYIRSDQPLYVGGPLWRIDVVTSSRPAPSGEPGGYSTP